MSHHYIPGTEPRQQHLALEPNLPQDDGCVDLGF